MVNQMCAPSLTAAKRGRIFKKSAKIIHCYWLSVSVSILRPLRHIWPCKILRHQAPDLSFTSAAPSGLQSVRTLVKDARDFDIMCMGRIRRDETDTLWQKESEGRERWGAKWMEAKEERMKGGRVKRQIGRQEGLWWETWNQTVTGWKADEQRD